MSETLLIVMTCPLCGAGLTENDRSKTERYHCRACFEQSAEARKGWLPSSRTVPAGQPLPANGLTRALDDDPMFSKGADGKVITRERACECGSRFTQRLLSSRFLAMCERQNRATIDAVTKQIPGYFVPVHCPPCERRDLGHASRLAEHRREYSPERSHAAD